MAVPASSNAIYYEQPLTKPVRLFLRFEQLVERFRVGVSGHSSTESHIALLALLDLYQHGMHVDLKAEVLRELDRSLGVISSFDKASERYSPNQLLEVKLTLEQGIEATNRIHGQLGAQLKDHHFFNLIRQRITIGGGVNSFDLPIYHLWTVKQPEERLTLLEDWAKPYLDLNEVISSLLSVMRSHCTTREHLAEQGFFQQSIPANENWKLLRIVLPTETRHYPEVSAGRQRFSIRFFEPSDLSARPGQTQSNVRFKTMYCGLLAAELSAR